MNTTNYSHTTIAYKHTKQKIKTDTLKIAAWNSNGRPQRANETKIFLYNNNINILLVSQTYFTPKSYIKIPYYTIYDTTHPSEKVHGGTAVIIRNDIKHHLHRHFNKEYIQATTVTVQTSSNCFQLSAVYVSPRHKITSQMWEEYFQDLGDKYIAAGDYNSKHTLWGSRNTTPRGRTLEKYIRKNYLNILSTGTPTYWPIDLNKKPDLLDFAVTRGPNTNKLKITPNHELSSDHTPIIIEYRNKPIHYSKPETLCKKTTKWQTFKEIIESKINCNIPLKTPEHIEQAVATLTATIPGAARTTTTPESTCRQTITIPQEILDKIRKKRKAKAKWKKYRTRENKKHLNKLANEINNKIKEHNDSEFAKFIGTLSTHENTNYSLWKATKKIRKPIIPVPAIRKADNTWARSNEE